MFILGLLKYMMVGTIITAIGYLLVSIGGSTKKRTTKDIILGLIYNMLLWPLLFVIIPIDIAKLRKK